jgi:hypothetical protein
LPENQPFESFEWNIRIYISDTLPLPWQPSLGNDLSDLHTIIGGVNIKNGIEPSLPSGKFSHSYGKSPLLVGKSTINGP